MISPRQALKTLGRRASKGLGQHFLIHQATAEKIARALDAKPGDAVVEIGAGLGALTEPLSQTGAHVIAVEIDPELTSFLRKQLQNLGSSELLEIECVDVLRLDFSALSHRFRSKLKIIGNLPYNISSQVLFKLMEEVHCIKEAVLMLQNEVAARVLAEPGGRDYGILSVMATYHSERKRLMRLRPHQFHPPPKVDSTVIGLSFRACPLTPQVASAWLLRVAKEAFAHRRKTLRNSLLAGNLPNLTPKALDAILEQTGIEPRRRPESLSLEEFLRLAKGLERVRGKQ
ncbi:MAG: ribosomal RNA small subunit methyltransferase A [Deltaproteobacteria bacterium]|nr:MAG: ribosomal RNA small subunit methyltransferase A [Deltaproteobacteria bacterium]